MSLHSWLRNLRSALAPRRGQRQHAHRGPKRAPTQRPSLAQNGQLLVDPGGSDGTLVSQGVVTLFAAKKDGKGGTKLRITDGGKSVRARAA